MKARAELVRIWSGNARGRVALDAGDRLIPSVAGGRTGQRGGASVRRSDYHNYDDDEDDDNNFSNYVLVPWSSNLKCLLRFGHGCSRHRTQPHMNIIMVWARMLSSSDAVEHEHYYGLGTDALVIRWSQT